MLANIFLDGVGAWLQGIQEGPTGRGFGGDVGEVAGGLSCQARAHACRQGGVLLESMPLFFGGGGRSLHGVVTDMGVEVVVE
jgi:hypothetical protein